MQAAGQIPATLMPDTPQVQNIFQIELRYLYFTVCAAEIRKYWPILFSFLFMSDKQTFWCSSLRNYVYKVTYLRKIKNEEKNQK